jgi:hypothetical protein
MSEVMNISNVMKISVLGYNFADWIKQFNTAFKQSDGKYNYMEYLSKLNNPAAYYILAGRLGSEEANNFLNELLTPTMNSIVVVGGKKGQKGGCGKFCIILIIFLLFMASIESAFAGEAVEKLKQFDIEHPEAKIEPVKPEKNCGYLWCSNPPEEKINAYIRESELFKKRLELQIAALREQDSEEAKRMIKSLEKQRDVAIKDAGEARKEQAEIVRELAQVSKNGGFNPEMIASIMSDQANLMIDKVIPLLTDPYEKMMILQAQVYIRNGIGVGAALIILYVWYNNKLNMVKNMRLSDIMVEFLRLRHSLDVEIDSNNIIEINGSYWTNQDNLNRYNRDFQSQSIRYAPGTRQVNYANQNNNNPQAQIGDYNTNANVRGLGYIPGSNALVRRGGKSRKQNKFKKSRRKY